VVSVTMGQTCGRNGCSTYWTPVIAFTANGHSYEFTGPQYSSDIVTGTVVKVSYDPQNPTDAHDISASANRGLLEMGVGVVLIVIALVSLLFGFRRAHGIFGLPSAREGTGWVGQRHLHSVAGVVVSVVLLVTLLAITFVVH